jgi:opacity protein-like surface antigen
VNIKNLLTALSAAAVAGAAQANNVVDTPVFSGLTATFEALHSAGSFTDTFTFLVSGSTTASVSIVTIGAGVADIDFTGSTLNGAPLALTTDAGGFVELMYTPSAYAVTGPLTLVITGTSGANASYTGSLNVGAVPEAGTLALMLAGLGAVGWVARRRHQA